MESIILGRTPYPTRVEPTSSPEPGTASGPSTTKGSNQLQEEKKRTREEKELRRAEKEKRREAKRAKRGKEHSSMHDVSMGEESHDHIDPTLLVSSYTTKSTDKQDQNGNSGDGPDEISKESDAERRKRKEEKRRLKAERAERGEQRNTSGQITQASDQPSSKVRMPPVEIVPTPSTSATKKRKRHSSPTTAATTSTATSAAASRPEPASTSQSTPSKARIITSRAVRQPVTPASSSKTKANPTTTPRSASRARTSGSQGPGSARGKSAPAEEKVDDDTLRLILTGPKAVQEWMATTWVREEEMRRLERIGVLTFKRGKFSEDEKIAIRGVLSTYQKVHRLSDTQLVELIMSTAQNSGLDKEDFRSFWLELAAAVPGRPVVYVQNSVRRLFDPKGHKGAWTPEEDEALMRAFTKHPNQWSKISDIVDRTMHDCRDRYVKELAVKSGRVIGRWSEEEDEKLIENIKALNRSLGRDENERDDISWGIIAKGMNGVRSAKQCRVRWTDIILPKMDGKVTNLKRDRLVILDRLEELNLKSEKHIDWTEVMKGSELSQMSRKHVTNIFQFIKKVLPAEVREGLSWSDHIKAMRKYCLTHGQGVGQLTRSGPPQTQDWIESDDDESDKDEEKAQSKGLKQIAIEEAASMSD